MKKIINGKKYDTETATSVWEYSSNYACSDYKYYDETLYKKKTGEFFLYGEGGPASKYAQKTIGGYTGGKEIIPLTEKDAKEWAEERLDCDEYEALFGEVEE